MLNLNTTEKSWASTAAARFEHKLRAVRERSAEKIPNRAVDGVHNNKIFEGNRDDADGICWWTNGFWAGMLWQAYHATHDDRYAEIARFTERTLDECFSCYYGLHHDVGFMWLPSAVADYRLTGDADARRRGLHAAQLLAGRFNPAGYIRAWNDFPNPDTDTRGWAIIDCLFNIPLLYWASEETKDPRFKKLRSPTPIPWPPTLCARTAVCAISWSLIPKPARLSAITAGRATRRAPAGRAGRHGRSTAL